MQNETVQDSWFLLFISAIKAHLRLVGVITPHRGISLTDLVTIKSDTY
jgi:hypothetical protein